jgi:hypothetical protein
MKKIFTLIALLFSLSTFANTIIVKGYVRDSTGKGIANRYVRIATDTVTTSNTCAIAHYKITNANGFYIDTVTCSTDIKKLLVFTESCGAIITKTLTPTTNIAECNFTICVPPTVTLPALSYVIVKGQVKDSSGKAIANHLVKIFTDSSFGSSCSVGHIKYTNNNGYYLDTLYCNAPIKQVVVSAEACGRIVTKTIVVVNGIAESNFIICLPPVAGPPDPLSFVIVKGNVEDSSGKAIANYIVKIFTDSTFGSSCKVSHIKYTNANGFYIDTLYCTTAIKYVGVSSEACGRGITNKVAVVNGVAESNFIICLPITVTPPTVPACAANFVYTQQLVGVKFNSSMSFRAPNDSIIGRKWMFGDGDTAYNVVDPIHIYKRSGTFNVCLNIKTVKGCESKICKTITVTDSLPNSAGSILEPVKIVILYPNPVHDKMNALVWNFNTSTKAELSIVDIYGQKKWGSSTTLLKGNNGINVNVNMLPNGPYFFKVTTAFGVVSRKFYKL